MIPVPCECGCWKPAMQLHHVVYVQELRRLRGDPKDERNLIPLALTCHAEHHSRQKPLPLACLPDDVYEFAAELMGAPYAYEYLRRYYAGEDPRHDALIAGEEQAA